MDKPTIVLGKKLVSRTETIQWYVDKVQHKNAVIGISAFYALIAWIIKVLGIRQKFIYYCIDFYDPRATWGWWDSIFIWVHLKIDRFLAFKADENWVISERIKEGRISQHINFCPYSKTVPLTYPPTYFRNVFNNNRYQLVYVGINPNGIELVKEIVKEMELTLVTIGLNKKFISTEKMLDIISHSGIGIALWEKEIDNHYYGDPGKTKLYLVCGIPVIVSLSATFSGVIEKEGAGVAINYDKKLVIWAINRVLANYDFYKSNAIRVGKKYCNAEKVYEKIRLLK